MLGNKTISLESRLNGNAGNVCPMIDCDLDVNL